MSKLSNALVCIKFDEIDFASRVPPRQPEAQFLTILKISGFCQKFGFWVLWVVTGDSGILEMSVFLVFSRFQNFDFFGFLVGLKILVCSYGAVLVGVSMM